MNKPRLSFSEIWNMSFGFLGIQFGFALQNANASRILQTFGADVEHLSWFWLVAPLTGMIVQPIIGHYSDSTWTKLGRRRPYFLVGATLASIALVLMPNSGSFAVFIPPLFVGAGLLMIMDASINIAMEPFRALVADKLPPEQRTTGFSVQTLLIGIGAVVGSFLPWILLNWFGVSGSVTSGIVGNNVIYSFYVGAVILMASIIWTVLKTKEYSPEEMALFSDFETPEKANGGGLASILKDFINMPKAMRQLGLTQFFSWFALFSMWVFTTPAIAAHFYGTTDPNSASYQEAGDWVGVIFAIYNGISAIFAMLLPLIAAKIGRKATHALCLSLGGLGLLSFYVFSDPHFLIISMIGVGIAWASILAMPYAILAGSIPAHKMGIYMGIFNFFITFPQIVNGVFGGPIVKYVYGGHAIYAIVFAGVFMILGAISVLRVEDKDEIVQSI